ncbi:hypothetical protein [Saccharibacillus sacchari]|uniref:hypothetical protein n=1 Tax=Saccharibacillus sacchari TaxID=456493 RepID=UPI0004BB1FCC|nr:hypothetical protein [Saccharibacillus sacchari]
MSVYERACERVGRIDVERYIGNEGKRYEEIRSKGEYEADSVLIAEYYRRVGVFLQSISKEAAGIYAGMDMLIGYKIAEEAWDEFHAQFPQFKPLNNWLMKFLCMHYLRWCLLIDAGEEKALQFPDVYEPMIMLFEKGGGGISTHHGELVGGFGAFSKTIDSSRGDQKPYDISEEGLTRATKEIEVAEKYLSEYKAESLEKKMCIRCGNHLEIQEHPSQYLYGGTWYTIKCKSPNCFSRNFS